MRTVIGATKLVFSNAVYLTLTLSIAFVVFTVAVWLPNAALIQKILTTSSASLSEKINLLVSFYGSIATNFTLISATYTIAIALLFGVSVSMFAFYIRQQRTMSLNSASATSLSGLIAGFFGIGCAACGSFILTSLLGISGGVVLAFLPLGGIEFGLLGVGLLGYSIYKTSQLIQKPLVCAIE